MKFFNGLWHYRVRTYATLREALLAALRRTDEVHAD